jgi:hypothetical protein
MSAPGHKAAAELPEQLAAKVSPFFCSVIFARIRLRILRFASATNPTLKKYFKTIAYLGGRHVRNKELNHL